MQCPISVITYNLIVTLSSSIKIGILGMITLANPENERPNNTNGKTEMTHSFKQLGSIAKLK